jgi:predicted metal-dependent HD superfamily phosphohydrolase
MLQQIFINNLSQFTDNQMLISKFWLALEKLYESKNRYYHTLTHIEQVYFLLEKNKSEIADWETLVCSVFYHDAIYNVLKSNNEERSADLAAKHLRLLNVDNQRVEKCCKQIIATKKHEKTSDYDTDLFTDADLAILGSDWNTYAAYAKNIRKEYSIYPDFLYNNGRKKVVQHFLAMENIFKTSLFQGDFEKKARINLKQELNNLT